MNNLIEVKTNISYVDTHFSGVRASFDVLEALQANITDFLAEDDKWAGKSHNKCVQTHDLLKEYFTAIRPLCVDFKAKIEDLINTADTFKNDSNDVTKLINW